jgi:hypothetical protein
VKKHKPIELFERKKHTDEASGALNQELAACHFEDVRVGRRFKKVVRQLARNIGQPIPLACQDWANTKAAYRFLSNRRVNESAILAGHFQATRERAIAAGGPILVLHDTTEFTFSRESVEAIGILKTSFSGWAKDGRPRQHTLCGILMHSSLAVTVEGLPLGLTAVKFWTRSKFKGTNALKRTVNPTRVPIEQKESIRWLENLEHSNELVGAPAAVSILVTGKATSTNCSARLKRAAQSFSCAPAWTDLLMIASVPSRRR